MGGLLRTVDLADGSSVPKKWQLARHTPTPKPGCPRSKAASMVYGCGPGEVGVGIKKPK